MRGGFGKRRGWLGVFVAAVGDKLEATEQRIGHFANLEGSISQLYESVENNREYTQQIAEGAMAARAV